MKSAILILEDLPDTRAWLFQLLRKIFPNARITAVGSIEEANEKIDVEKFELAIVDLSLPDGSGVDIIARLKQEQPECLSVVATIFDDDAHLFPALQAGAEGYLLKEQGEAQLADLLRGIVSGTPPLSPAIARRLLKYFKPSEDLAKANLTNREKEVLILIAKGMKLSEVAGALGISLNTVAGYVKTIYRKLNVSSRAEATLAATRFGLVHPT